MNSYPTRIASIVFPLLMLAGINVQAQEKHGSMSDDQKTAVKHMHHDLEGDQAPYKAKEAQAQKELNEMTIREDVSIEEIHAKIDELMAAKNMILRLRYEHLVEMRKTLTDEQKVDYDKNVLKRSEIK
jgi:hypothetical protein